MYSGEVNITQEQLSHFLQTADLLHVRGLADADESTEKPAQVRQQNLYFSYNRLS